MRPSLRLSAQTHSSQASTAGKAAPVSTAIWVIQPTGLAAPKMAATATMACTNSTARSTTPTWQVSNTRSRARTCSGISSSDCVPRVLGRSWKVDKIRESFMGRASMLGSFDVGLCAGPGPAPRKYTAP